MPECSFEPGTLEHEKQLKEANIMVKVVLTSK